MVQCSCELRCVASMQEALPSCVILQKPVGWYLRLDNADGKCLPYCTWKWYGRPRRQWQQADGTTKVPCSRISGLSVNVRPSSKLFNCYELSVRGFLPVMFARLSFHFLRRLSQLISCARFTTNSQVFIIRMPKSCSWAWTMLERPHSSTC